MIGTLHIVLTMKPTQGNFAKNALAFGVAGINVDGCRIATDNNLNGGVYSGLRREKTTEWQNADRSKGRGSGFRQGIGEYIQPQGRWPANVIHDGSADVLVGFPTTISGQLLRNHFDHGKDVGRYGKFKGREKIQDFGGDSGSAARFFKQIDEFQLQKE